MVCNQQTFHPHTYHHKDSAIGQVITVDGKEYRIIRMPFYEFGGGGHYAVTYPVEVQAMDKCHPDKVCLDGSRYNAISANHAIDAYTETCGVNLNGTKVIFKIRDDITYSSRNGYASGFYVPEFHVYSYQRASLSVQIGETNLSMGYLLSSTYQETQVKTDDGDYVDEIQWDAIQHPDRNIEILKELMNYVWVEKL